MDSGSSYSDDSSMTMTIMGSEGSDFSCDEEVNECSNQHPFHVTGNVIIDFPSFERAMKNSFSCKCCMCDNIDSFAAFCEEKKSNLFKEIDNKRSSSSKLKHIQWHMNIWDGLRNGTKITRRATTSINLP